MVFNNEDRHADRRIPEVALFARLAMKVSCILLGAVCQGLSAAWAEAVWHGTPPGHRQLAGWWRQTKEAEELIYHITAQNKESL